MANVRFATICDYPGCARRSEEYSSWPTCRDCDKHICPEHQAKGSASGEEENLATCLTCGQEQI